MVHKVLRIAVAVAICLVVAMVVRGPSAPDTVTTSFDVTVYPIEGSDGDFMVEFPDGSREVLKKGGKRHPAVIKDTK